jgi:hypothetical protein
MRKFTILVLSLLAFGAFALAQLEPQPLVVPKTEFFIGYAFQRAGVSGYNIPDVTVDSTNLNGFAFEFSHYMRGNFGYTVDISRGSNSKVDSTGIKYVRSTYLAGPSYRLHNFLFFTPSVHALAGVDHDQFTVPEINPTVLYYANTDFAAAAGVTFDGNLSRHLAARLAQVDYLYTHNYGASQSSFRYTGGLVVRF